MTTPEQRRDAVGAWLHLFQVHAQDVIVDLSPTRAWRDERDQWAGAAARRRVLRGSPSYYIFRDAVRGLFPFEP